MKKILAILLLVGMVFGSGCAPTENGRWASISYVPTNHQPRIDPGKLTTGDYMLLAESLMNKLLGSPLIRNSSTPPRLIFATPINLTQDENLRAQAIANRVYEILLSSQEVRLVHQSSTAFDYIIEITVTDNMAFSYRQRTVDHTLSLRAYTPRGELVAVFNADISVCKY